MTCIPAKACRIALAEATALWPGRNKASDGICGDASHQSRASDHNSGEAFDLTHDPSKGVDCFKLSERLRQWVLGDIEDRVKYVIFYRRIFNPSVSPNWRTYFGSNPHTSHMHVSIRHDSRNDVSSWWTKEDDMTPEQEAKLDSLIAELAVHRLRQRS